jgi:hypothetical protein
MVNTSRKVPAKHWHARNCQLARVTNSIAVMHLTVNLTESQSSIDMMVDRGESMYNSQHKGWLLSIGLIDVRLVPMARFLPHDN